MSFVLSLSGLSSKLTCDLWTVRASAEVVTPLNQTNLSNPWRPSDGAEDALALLLQKLREVVSYGVLVMQETWLVANQALSRVVQDAREILLMAAYGMETERKKK
ncbi:MAG: hypothetical protein LQ341_001234 [Variospora aurantia]|nr:MAG: hypothetical protein LQ341_001234 [Variospora aurantia]